MAKHIMQIPHCIPFCLLSYKISTQVAVATVCLPKIADCLAGWLRLDVVSMCVCVCACVFVAVAVGCCCLPAAWHCQSLEKKRNHLATFGCNSFSH